MGFKGNRFNGQLQTITKLFNGTLQCYESALLLQKCWFLFFGKNPFPLLINKSCVPNTAQRPKTTVSLWRAGVFRSHCYIQILSWRQRKKESKKMLPHMFSFLLSKTHFLFFPVCFSVQNFKAVETGWWSGKEGELCTFSRRISIRTNNMVVYTWRELIEKHCL